MKIIIAGDGKVGVSLTRKLSQENHDITLIDSNQSVLDTNVERFDVMAVQGNCASMAVLRQAGIMDAGLLIAAASADEINLLFCLTAHGMNPKLHTIARIRNPEYEEQIYTMREKFALSLTVNPEKQAAAEIERQIKYPGFLHRDTFAKGRVEIVELRIDPGSKLCDVRLNELNTIVKCKVLVCVVKRNGQAVIPDGNFCLKTGDRILVTAPAKELTLLLKNLGIIAHKAKRAILCGGGHVSYYLAQNLIRSGIQVEIIEQNRERCRELANSLPEATIVCGDASNQFLLESENVEHSDALVTATGLDEMNMIVSLYGKNVGVPQIITKVSHVENSNIQDSLDLGCVICPKELCCDSIVRYVRALQNKTGAALTVHALADGKAEAMEFLVDEKTMHLGIPLKELTLRKNVLVACISRKNMTEFPNGNSVFEMGDIVIVVSSGDVVLQQLNDIFSV